MKKSNRGATTPVATDVVADADAPESPTNGRNGSSALVDESTPEQASELALTTTAYSNPTSAGMRIARGAPKRRNRFA